MRVLFSFCLLTVTSHSATKRRAGVNRKPPLTGTARWATAAQPPPPVAANWTAAPRRWGSGSPERKPVSHAVCSEWRGTVRGVEEKCNTRRHLEDGHILFLCLHEPSSYITQARGVKGAIFIRCMCSYCPTSGIYLILFQRTFGGLTDKIVLH